MRHHVIALVVAGAMPSTAAASGPPWRAGAGLGVGVAYVEGSSFARQLAAAAYEPPFVSWSVSGSVEREVSGWLVLGADLDVDARTAEQSSELLPGVSAREGVGPTRGYALYEAVVLVRAMPVFGGGALGLDVALGGGGALWVLGGEAEAGAAVRLRGLLTMSPVPPAEWSFRFRFGAQQTFLFGLGPRSLFGSMTDLLFDLGIGRRW